MLTTMFDAPMRMTITMTDGTTKVVDAMGYTVNGAIRQASSKAKLEEKKEKVPDSAKTYPVPEFTDEELRDLTSGGWDDPALVVTKPHQKRINEALCAMRRKFFNLSDVSYTVRDAILLTTMLTAGIRPSTLAQAILMASKDTEFWAKQGDISFKNLQDNHSKLAGRYANQRSDPKAYILAKLPILDDIDPAFAKAVRENMSKAKDVEFAEIATNVKARIAAHGKP